MPDAANPEIIRGADFFHVSLSRGNFKDLPGGITFDETTQLVDRAFQDKSSQKAILGYFDSRAQHDPDVTQLLDGYNMISAIVKNYGRFQVVSRAVRQSDGAAIIVETPRTMNALGHLENDYRALQLLKGRAGYFPRTVSLAQVPLAAHVVPAMFMEDFPCLELNMYDDPQGRPAMQVNDITPDTDIHAFGLGKETLFHPVVQQYLKKELAKILAMTYGITGHLPEKFNVNTGDIVLKLYDDHGKMYNCSQLSEAVGRNDVRAILAAAQDVLHPAMITFRGAGVRVQSFNPTGESDLQPVSLSWLEGANPIRLDSIAAEKLVIALQKMRIPTLENTAQISPSTPLFPLYDNMSGNLIRSAVREAAAIL